MCGLYMTDISDRLGLWPSRIELSGTLIGVNHHYRVRLIIGQGDIVRASYDGRAKNSAVNKYYQKQYKSVFNI